jgi:hypothetical protein
MALTRLNLLAIFCFYNSVIVIYEMSAKRHFSCMSALFDERRRSECFICANMPNTSSRIEVRTIFFETNIMSDLLYTFVIRIAKVSIELIALYFHSFEIFITQIGEMAFGKPEFIIIKSNYFQNAKKGECFLDDFEALVRERRFRALLCGREMSF